MFGRVLAADGVQQVAVGVITPHHAIARVGHEDVVLMHGDAREDCLRRRRVPTGEQLAPRDVADLYVIPDSHVQYSAINREASWLALECRQEHLARGGCEVPDQVVARDVDSPVGTYCQSTRLAKVYHITVDLAVQDHLWVGLAVPRQVVRVSAFGRPSLLDVGVNGVATGRGGGQQDRADQQLPREVAPPLCHAHSLTSRQTMRVRSRTISRPPARAIGPHDSCPLSTRARASGW